MKTADEQLKVLNDKLQLLIKKFITIQKENAALADELNDCRLQEKNSKEKIARLEMETSILKASAGKMDDKERTSFEKTINQYIKDLEKGIAMLNK